MKTPKYSALAPTAAHTQNKRLIMYKDLFIVLSSGFSRGGRGGRVHVYMCESVGRLVQDRWGVVESYVILDSSVCLKVNSWILIHVIRKNMPEIIICNTTEGYLLNCCHI